MIRVLIVEDSPVVQQLMEHILQTDPSIKIVGIANNGIDAVEMVKQKRPDAITMDIHMPKLDGITATRIIMETNPTPIIIVSSSFLDDEVTSTFQAIEAGALAVLHRPAGIGHPDYQKTAEELITTVKLMSEVKVVRRSSTNAQKNLIDYDKTKETSFNRAELSSKKEYKIVAIGASTGGPLVLQTILSSINKDFSLPILIVQHIAEGFLKGFVEWLSQSSNLPIHIAEHNQLIKPGNVYVAPENFNMGLSSFNKILLDKSGTENGHKPSVSYLFRTVASVVKSNAIGILLTGMGKDGAQELKLIKDKGGLTIVQNLESSVVHGMPGEAIKLDGVVYTLPPVEIANLLNKL
ncbi:chemotaxis-specific protein-glutamate methyltransferase CheB [Melioribacteraceae bacterium 4301-Me]|uniref:chemotaxis-specific protein-glutamate methyltransferase CheB n=1 Tax=Pyranulibacter aquaticus TaxID=3163344 RepID=UPI003596C3E9